MHHKETPGIPDYTEFTIGPAEGRTRWLHPGYEPRNGRLTYRDRLSP